MFSVKQVAGSYINIVLTHECNKSCQFCIDKYRGDKGFISLDSVANAISFAEQQGLEDVLLTGGEPCMHPRLKEIAHLVRESKLRSVLTTNYTLPSILKSVDGVIDCFNISNYPSGLWRLPSQSDFSSDLTISTIIYSGQLGTRDSLDSFIDQFEHRAHLKFSTLTDCNDWTHIRRCVPYLDLLPWSEWVVLFNEMIGQIYRGHIIKRCDMIINKKAAQSFKCHVDGKITRSWDRSS